MLKKQKRELKNYNSYLKTIKLGVVNIKFFNKRNLIFLSIIILLLFIILILFLVKKHSLPNNSSLIFNDNSSYISQTSSYINSQFSVKKQKDIDNDYLKSIFGNISEIPILLSENKRTTLMLWLDDNRIILDEEISENDDYSIHNPLIYDTKLKKLSNISISNIKIKRGSIVKYQLLENNKICIMLGEKIYLINSDNCSLINTFDIPKDLFSESIDISPNCQKLVYVSESQQSLFVCNLDLTNKIVLNKGTIIDNNPETATSPKYPKWLENNKVFFIVVGYEWLISFGTINSDGSNYYEFKDFGNEDWVSLLSADFLLYDTHQEKGIYNLLTKTKKPFNSYYDDVLDSNKDFSIIAFLNNDYDKNGVTINKSDLNIINFNDGNILKSFKNVLLPNGSNELIEQLFLSQNCNKIVVKTVPTAEYYEKYFIVDLE